MAARLRGTSVRDGAMFAFESVYAGARSRRRCEAGIVMTRLTEIIERVESHKAELRNFHVRSLALFGSTARDEAGPESDVDMLVEFDEPVDLFVFCDVEAFLARVVGRNVDLVLQDSVKPLLRERILSEAVRVF